MSSEKQIGFVQADVLNDQTLVVEFSDNTTTTFTVEQLIALKSERWPSDDPAPNDE